MTENAVRTPPPIGNAIRRLLRRHGVSERAMSDRLGKGKTWLSDRLRGRYPLTFESVEDIAQAVGLSLRDVLAEAYPDPADPTASPYAMLVDLAPERETRPLPPHLLDDLEALLAHAPNVRTAEPPNYDILRGIQNSIWFDRSRAVQYALFHLSEATKPRFIYTFIGALAILSDVVRACRQAELFHRSQILLHAHRLLELHPHPRIAALVTEKTAYLNWCLTSNSQIAVSILEHPSTIPHPFPDQLFACRGRFCMIREQHDAALAYVDLVLSLNKSVITVASACNVAANVHANQGDPAAGLSYLEKALELSNLPSDLQTNLEAETARFHLMLGDADQALDTFSQIIANRSYCDLWPLKAGFVALDFLKAGPAKSRLIEALPRLLEIQANLDIQRKSEAAVLRALAPLLSIATTTSRLARQREDVDPNG